MASPTWWPEKLQHVDSQSVGGAAKTGGAASCERAHLNLRVHVVAPPWLPRVKAPCFAPGSSCPTPPSATPWVLVKLCWTLLFMSSDVFYPVPFPGL